MVKKQYAGNVDGNGGTRSLSQLLSAHSRRTLLRSTACGHRGPRWSHAAALALGGIAYACIMPDLLSFATEPLRTPANACARSALEPRKEIGIVVVCDGAHRRILSLDRRVPAWQRLRAHPRTELTQGPAASANGRESMAVASILRRNQPTACIPPIVAWPRPQNHPRGP
jgi:hypothetical protein